MQTEGALEIRGSAASQVNILHQQDNDPPAQEHLFALRVALYRVDSGADASTCLQQCCDSVLKLLRLWAGWVAYERIPCRTARQPNHCVVRARVSVH